MLGAVRVRGDALQRRLVLVEEALAGGEELLADVLVLVVGEDGHRPHQPEGPPHDGEGCSHDLAVAFLGDEASPRLHEPAVVHVLGAVEDLPRARAHLALEEIAEGLLEDVTHLAEIALADAPDLDQGRAPLIVQSRPIHGGSHEGFGIPASSSSSVITPE